MLCIAKDAKDAKDTGVSLEGMSDSRASHTKHGSINLPENHSLRSLTGQSGH